MHISKKYNTFGPLCLWQCFFFIFCHWTAYPAHDTVDCGGHRAISCHHCWYNKTSDVKLDQDFYVSWEHIYDWEPMNLLEFSDFPVQKYARTMCNGDCWFRTVGLNCRYDTNALMP